MASFFFFYILLTLLEQFQVHTELNGKCRVSVYSGPNTSPNPPLSTSCTSVGYLFFSTDEPMWTQHYPQSPLFTLGFLLGVIGSEQLATVY